MARRGFLDYVLGGAVGGLEGLAQKRAAEEERKRMADAAAMDQARLLMQLNYRVAPDAYDTEDPAARSILPPLEMPSAAPPPAARASGALSAALNRGMGVDTTQPSLSRPSFGAKPLAMDIGGSNMTKMFESAKQTRAAQEPIAASVTLPGGQKVRFNAPESAAQIASRTRTESDAKRSQELAQALSALSAFTPEQRAQYEPLVRATFAGVPSSVLSSILTPPTTRARRTQLVADTGQLIDLDTGEIISIKGRYVIPPTGASASGQPTPKELAEAAAAFADPSLAPFMQQGLAALRASGDKRPEAVLKFAVYEVLKARANIPTSLGGARESSGFNYLTGGFGSNPAAAGIPGEAPPAAPPAAPVATPKPAPAPIADQALEEDRRLYDAGVAKHGSARMLAEYGKRP